LPLTVKPLDLTPNEQKVLFGIVSHPELNDSELAKKYSVKLSTLTSIKRRLHEEKVFQQLTVPLLNKLGSEILAVIYTQFNPVIPLEERVQTAKETIEVFDEIFVSIGEQEKGFSISLSKNYTNIGQINEIRTETFGRLGLLEKEYPTEVVFPFSTSSIMRFFDFSRAIGTLFDIPNDTKDTDEHWFKNGAPVRLTEKEKMVYVSLVGNPNETTQQIGELVGLSRHTVSRMKKKFFDLQLLKQITVPDLHQLGFEILAFYHLQFNPGRAPSKEDIDHLDTSSTIFLARRKFETIILSAYPTYQHYKEDKMEKIRYLKENDFISYTPQVRKYMFDRMVFLKYFDFAPISRKILQTK